MGETLALESQQTFNTRYNYYAILFARAGSVTMQQHTKFDLHPRDRARKKVVCKCVLLIVASIAPPCHFAIDNTY